MLESFQEILSIARERAGLLFATPIVDGRHLGVPAVASLAHHLLCRYTVPEFLASYRYTSDAAADRKRRWFVEHACGNRCVGTGGKSGFPPGMTKKGA